MARSVTRTGAVATVVTLVLGLAVPTADGERVAALPPCPSPVAGSLAAGSPAAGDRPAAGAGAAEQPPTTEAPSLADPGACRAQPTRVERADTGQLPVPQPGYHYLGGTTTGQWAGALGRLGVRDTGVRADSFDFVATRLLAKRGTGDGGTIWLEVGWADTGWSGQSDPRVYTFDSAGMSWAFYDQYRLRDGDRVWVYLHSQGSAWQAWLWWDERWQLLNAPRLPLGAQARIEQYVEVHLDGTAGAGAVEVPPVPVDGVHLQPDPGAPLQRWHGQVPTVVLDGRGRYCLTWHRAFDDWSAGDCAD